MRGPFTVSPSSQQLYRAGGAIASEKPEVREAPCLVQGLTAGACGLALPSGRFTKEIKPCWADWMTFELSILRHSITEWKRFIIFFFLLIGSGNAVIWEKVIVKGYWEVQSSNSHLILNLVAAMLALRRGLSVLFLLLWIQGKSPFFWMKG